MSRNIKIGEEREHSKASERYVSVTFQYPSGETWVFDVPVEYRRTGLNLSRSDEIAAYLQEAYTACDPSKHKQWLEEQASFWADHKPRAAVTKSFFDKLTDFKWHCVACGLPKNTNFARRVQALKEMGYTLATNTKKYCPLRCKANKTHLLLLPLPKGEITGYENWSPKLRRRIVKLLGGYDAFEARKVDPFSLLPDHKFPEIRWDEGTRRASLEDLTDEEIVRDFQLLNNQRNQQKREVCRTCFQTGNRGFPFGVEFYYSGSCDWPSSVPVKGKEAEKGCIGCGWYDLDRWRQELNRKLGKAG